MKEKYIVPLLLMQFLIPFSSQAKTTTAQKPKHRKIVVYQTNVNDSDRDAVVKKTSAKKVKRLHQILDADVVDDATDNDISILEKDPKVKRVDDDAVFTIFNTTPGQIGSQKIPWGVAKIGAPKIWSTTSGQKIKVGVIDTGIDRMHPDLASNIKGGYNAIDPTKSYTDDNGHGTHVAGIIGALNNKIGVVGVGPGVDLYAIKVMDSNGKGHISDIIEGLDWAIKNHMRVVNMSLGSPVDAASLHEAIITADNAGVVIVVAAGNDGGPVNYPAAYPEVIAVSAVDSNNHITSWSSRGAQITLAAPGLNIFSTYKGHTYKTLSGTSMATPHVTGAAALILSMPKLCEHLLDSISGCSPAEVKKRLEDTATPAGSKGRDSLYGAGILNVQHALTQ